MACMAKSHFMTEVSEVAEVSSVAEPAVVRAAAVS
jgi:hypothetical protein